MKVASHIDFIFFFFLCGNLSLRMVAVTWLCYTGGSDSFLLFSSIFHLCSWSQVLVTLHQAVIPYLSNPIMLCDFLTRSYEIGGVISVMALSRLRMVMELLEIILEWWMVKPRTPVPNQKYLVKNQALIIST
ncbi:uncharacterized protein LOC114301643 [Camellia sinensis]|uniref:uncharacterized protein LOC114301643 n=1 Tax=Camellia sinensis TaxID=4442 RepID=UPI001036B0FB|nr:uncharacterized protein LOC114301643 [Camellia sinensis]